MLILLLWRPGLRISEALDVEPADVRFDKPAMIRVRNGKGGKARVVPLHRELEEALAVALDYGEGSGPVVDVRRRQATDWFRQIVKKERLAMRLTLRSSFAVLGVMILSLISCGDNAAVHLEQGDVEYDQGNYRKAIQSYDKAIELDPKHTEPSPERRRMWGCNRE